MVKSSVYEVFGGEETERIGAMLASTACAGEVYALNGDLGAGKTTFARGFARGLGIVSEVCSPTFTIVREYQTGRIPLFHFDIYRIPDDDALWEIGWDDYFDRGGIMLVEWANQLPDSIPDTAITITIEKDLSRGEDYRRITIEEGDRGACGEKS